MSEIAELIRERIDLQERRLETYREMLRLAESLNGGLSTPAADNSTTTSPEPTTAKRAPRPVKGPVTRDAAEPKEPKERTSREQVLAFVREFGKGTTASVSERFGLSNKSARKHLANLLEAGELVTVAGRQQGVATVYRPAGAVPPAGSTRRQDPALEGNLMAYLAIPRDPKEIVSNFEGVDVLALERMLKVLLDEGNVEKVDGRYRAAR